MPKVMLFASFAVCALCHYVQLFAAEPSAKIKEFFKPKMLEILGGVDKIETFRIKEKGDGSYIQLAKGAIWKEAKAKEVAALFLDEKSYEWERKKLCDPNPGVMFRLWKGEDHFDAMLCFECDIVVFQTVDANGKGVAPKTNDFDPARPKLVKLAKEALPEDEVVKGLKENR